MTRVATAAEPDGSEDRGDVLDHVRCRCGSLAEVVVVHGGLAVVCVVECRCGSFTPVSAQGGER